MSSDPVYLRNLKRYARAHISTLEEIPAQLAEFGLESDRGAIILAATNVEDSLELAITEKMPSLSHDKEAFAAVFGADGTLSTYFDKTLIAYALGLIDKKDRKNIDLIRQIRNACAHSRKPLSLAMPVLADAIKAAVSPELFGLRKDDEPFTLRIAFVLHCAAVSDYVLTGQRKGITQMIREAMKNPPLRPMQP